MTWGPPVWVLAVPTPYRVTMTPEELAAGVVLLGAALGALTYIGKWVRTLVHVADRIETLSAETSRVVDKELTPNSGSSIKDQVTAAAVQATEAAQVARTTRGLLEVLAQDVADHGQQSRTAMLIYRKALADQGIHLPVAPGETGYGDTTPPTHHR